MKSKVVQMTGLVIAMAGAVTVASAQGEGGQDGRKRPQPLSAEEMIKKFDKDGDSKLSQSELKSLISEMKSRRPQGREGMNGRGGGGFSREEMLKKYDADGDGKLSAEERTKMMEDLRSKRRQRSE
jgi:hypothetical protein